MSRKRIINLLIAGLVLLQLSALGTAPAWADEGPTGPEKTLGDISPAPISLHLSLGSFDPLLTSPQEMLAQSGLSTGQTAELASLFNSAEQAQADGAYIVQFTGPVQEEWKQVLESLGAEIGPYLPDFAFIVRLDSSSHEKVASLSFVRWVGAYEPAYRISTYAWDQPRRSFRVLLLPWASSENAALSQVLAETNPQAYAPDALLAELDSAALLETARLPGVLWIEPLYLNEMQSEPQSGLQNDVAGTIMNAGTAWAASLNGTGIKVGVADTGLDTGVVGTLHGDFTGRVTNAYSYPVQAADYGGGCVISNAGADDGWSDINSGHGTHVAGSLAGSGNRSAGQFRGIAYNAWLGFQGIEQMTDFPPGCVIPDGFYLTGIPANAGVILSDAYAWGVRIHSNSWGTAAYKGYYDAQARSFDDVTSQNRDLLVVVAAGNQGKDLNADGYVDPDSVIAPATAKNVLTVGASDNEKNNPWLSTSTWGTSWPGDYPANPTRDDKLSDSRQELAAFSGRGPVDDGRIKPDLVAPGTNIVSTRSSLIPASPPPGWGIYDTYYMYNGGTSMATPLAAGAAALVRDYYIDQVGVANPSAALVKATLINTAVDITGYGNPAQEAGQPIPNMHEGWGRIDVGAAVTTGSRQFIDNASGLSTGGVQETTYSVTAGKPFKVSLVWSDIEASVGAAVTLVNDLDLEVVAPDGTTIYRGNVFSGGWTLTGGSADRRNNVENVYIQSPAAGIWKVRVRGFNIPLGPQPYALVMNGNVDPLDAPQITAVIPDRGLNNATLNGVAVNGSRLEGVYQVRLTRASETINGSVLVASPTQVVVNFGLTGATPGLWDVVVTAPSGSDTLSQGFAVLDSTLPDLVVTQTAAPTLVSIGDLVTYTVRLENRSQVSATSVSFVDTLPANMTFVSINPACAVFTPQTGSFTCQVGSLAGGAAATYQVVTQVSEGAAGFLGNLVEVSAAQADRWLPDNQASAKVVVDGSEVRMPVVIKGYPAVNPVRNPGFEEGNNGVWTWYSILGITPLSVPPNPPPAHSGGMITWLGGTDLSGHVETKNWIQQTVAVPMKATTLTYWYWISASDNCAPIADQVVVLMDGKQVHQQTLCSGSKTTQWVQAVVPVSSFAGQTVKLWFFLTQDLNYPSSFLLDDIEIK